MTSPAEKPKPAYLLNKLEKLQKEKEDLQTKLDNERSRSAYNIKAQVTIEELEGKLKNLELAKSTNVQRLESELKDVKEELTAKNIELDKVKIELETKQKEIQSCQLQLEVLHNQQHSELVQKGRMLESQQLKFKNDLAAKDNELSNVDAQLQHYKQMWSQLNENKAARDRDLSDLNAQLRAKDAEINQLSSKALNEKSRVQSYEHQLSQKDSELATMDQRCKDLDQQVANKNNTIDQLNFDLQQAKQRTKNVEVDRQSETQKLCREISALKQSYESQLSAKESELQACLANLELNSKNLSTLQGRFKNLLNEKGTKEAELKKAYSEIEDSFSKFDTFGKQIQQARDEITRLKQVIDQNNTEIKQLKEREQSAQNELTIRAEKIKAHEKMISGLQQQTQGQQKQIQEYDIKCEKLEGEVNRANAQRLHGRSRERSESEVTVAVARQNPDQKSHLRHGSNSSEGNRGSGYNQVPLNQTSGQYYNNQAPFQETPNRYDYPRQQPDMHGNRGYGPIPGPDPRSPPANQGGMRPMSGNQPYQGGPPPAGNQFNQHPYQPPPMNQQAGGFQSPPDKVFNQGGPMEMNSNPCPMCQKRFVDNDTMAIHAATCNYDPENH